MRALAHGVTPIPRGTGDRIEENLAARSLALTGDEVARTDRIKRPKRVYGPNWAPQS